MWKAHIGASLPTQFVSTRWHWFDSFCTSCSTGRRKAFLPSSAWNVLNQLFKCAPSHLQMIVPVRQVTTTGEEASIHLLCSSCPWSNLHHYRPPACLSVWEQSGSRLLAGFKLQLRESWTRRRRWATRVIKNSLPIENRRWDFYWMFSVHWKSHFSHFLWCF